ncbi:MAG: nitroreductase/quinone reductase family protein [Chloroflexota bacterium]
MLYNVFVKFFLRTPLHGLFSKTTMLLTLTGRKSGRKLTLPVSYYEADGALWTISRRNRTWWRNLKGGADVTLRLRGRNLPARGEAVLDGEAVAALLRDYLSRFPYVAKYLQIQMKDDLPDEADLREQAAQRLFVKFTLK